MIDISNGYHLLIQIKPSFGDEWIDHNGNQIGQLGFTTDTPQAVVVDGTNMAAVIWDYYPLRHNPDTYWRKCCGNKIVNFGRGIRYELGGIKYVEPII